MINLNGIPDTDVWFTADTHFGHLNVIEYANRPFLDVFDMDEKLISLWNGKVQPDHTVYHLADFTLGHHAARYFEKLNGRIHILGLDWHHDRRWMAREIGKRPIQSRSGWDVQILPPIEVLRVHDIDNDGYPMLITMSHYPLAEWEAKHYGAWHLHGHSHGNFSHGDGIRIDVGVDVQGYAPVNLRTIKMQVHQIEKRLE